MWAKTTKKQQKRWNVLWVKTRDKLIDKLRFKIPWNCDCWCERAERNGGKLTLYYYIHKYLHTYIKAMASMNVLWNLCNISNQGTYLNVNSSELRWLRVAAVGPLTLNNYCARLMHSLIVGCGFCKFEFDGLLHY